MRVLMLGWELPPYNSGGLGIACYQLCQALAGYRDIDIEFVLPYQAEHDIGFMDVTAAGAQDVLAFQQDGNVYDSRRYGYGGGLHEQQRVYEESVAKLTAAKEFDIIHAHDWLTFRAALRLKEQRGCPLVLHVHSVESDRAGSPHAGNPLVQEIEATALQLADRVIAVSEHTRAAIHRDYGVPLAKIDVIHNSLGGIDMPKLFEDNSYSYIEAMKKLGYKVVVNVGRQTIQKGLPNLLRAAKRVIEHQPKTLFLLVGSGEQYGELVSLAAELGIGRNVLFADFQRGKRWRDAFLVGDLFVMPSISEPFGLTPLEAIGYGTPTLISKQSGVAEVLPHSLKVDYWDVDEMANQIVGVLGSSALHRELLANSRRDLQRLSWRRTGAKVRRLYERHLAEVTP